MTLRVPASTCCACFANRSRVPIRSRAVAKAEPTELHVGYSPTPFAEILPRTLRAFQQAMPNVHVRLHDWSNNAIRDGLHDGRLQLGLIVPPVKASSMRGQGERCLQLGCHSAATCAPFLIRELIIRYRVWTND